MQTRRVDVPEELLGLRKTATKIRFEKKLNEAAS
jgi:hypothetical protein